MDFKEYSDQTSKNLLDAAKKGDEEELKRYLNEGANINYQDKSGRGAIHYAVENDNPVIVQTLLEIGCRQNMRDCWGKTAIDLAADANCMRILKILINNGCNPHVRNTYGKTALHLAVESHDMDLLRILIDKGCDQNLQEDTGQGAIHSAVFNNNLEAIQALIDSGCDMNLKDNNDKTALHYAAGFNKLNVSRILINSGCDKNMKDHEGNTALHIGALTANNQDIVLYLLNRGLDQNMLNIEGKKPIDVAVNEKMVAIFTDYENNLIPGLPAEVKKFDKKSAQVFSRLLEEETYPHFESRVMLVGEEGTGKSTIARHLVGKRPTRCRKSTNGIELYNDLSFMDFEANCWLGGQQDFSMEELTVSRSLLQDGNLKGKNFNLLDKTETGQHLQAINDKHAVDDTLTSERKELTAADVTASCADLDGRSSPETFIAESDHVTLRSKHQVQSTKVDVGYLDQDMSDQFSDKEVESKELQQNIIDRCGDGIAFCSSISSREESEILLDVTKILDVSKYENEVTKQESINENKSIESTDVTHSGNDSIDDDIAGNIEGNRQSGLGFSVGQHIETVYDCGLIRKLKNFFGVSKKVNEVKVSITKEKFFQKSSRVGKKQLHTRMIAPIIIWDFGGQDVFYSTHQTFLTYRAIYMVVLDGSRKIDDRCPFEQYLPGKSGHKTARDYLKFWINTIVTYCKGGNPGFPKIMIVLTHKDRVEADEVESRRHEIFAEINKMFQQTECMQHLVIEDKIFVNAKDEFDLELAMIKDIIIRESRSQPTWGELLPKCFIPLELEFASLIRHNMPLITLEYLMKINALQPIRPLTESELKVFLKFQHSIGKVMYFDTHKLDKHIILSPPHLIDAFKSIVTDKRFCAGDRKREEIWDLMGKKGVVSKETIQEIWRNKYLKFYKDKDYLLDVMTHLDILVEPQRYNTDHKRISADFYYVASMVRAEDSSGYLQLAGFTQRNIAIAFQSSSLMIPPALSFRLISYCLSVWAVKKYGDTNKDMLFHRSAVFTIDPSLDMHILCEDDKILVRLVHTRTNALILRDLASSINECLSSALEKISQLYIKTSSDQSQPGHASFITNICCSAPDNSCILPMDRLANMDQIWICQTHGIEHNINTIRSWFPGTDEDKCEPKCPVTNEEFLKVMPSDLHLRKLSILYSRNEIRELALQFGLKADNFDNVLNTEDPDKWKFEVFRKCRDKFALTFKDIQEASNEREIDNIHRICKLVKGDPIDFGREPEKWDLVPTEEHIDRLAPLIGNNSLAFLIELGMEFQTWEQISHRQNERYLVRLNKNILEEWSTTFCRLHILKPTLRKIAQAFSNIGKNIKIVEKSILDLF